jgi:ornithine cyclodeaminase/alanine dehydrogenase-like protein (mu-crystallin family)
LDDEVLHQSTIYVESREPALKESGDVIAADKELIEIGEVIAGKQSGRKSADQITLFKSVGVAIEDVATAELVLNASVSASGGWRKLAGGASYRISSEAR